MRSKTNMADPLVNYSKYEFKRTQYFFSLEKFCNQNMIEVYSFGFKYILKCPPLGGVQLWLKGCIFMGGLLM